MKHILIQLIRKMILNKKRGILFKIRKKFNKCSGKKLPQCIMYIQKLKLELQHFLLIYFRETDTEIGPRASTNSKNFITQIVSKRVIFSIPFHSKRSAMTQKIIPIRFQSDIIHWKIF